MPQQLASLYDALYLATGNADDRRKAQEIIAGEVRRYGRNLIYYRSLSPSQYASLQRTDMFIDQSYVPSLLSLYHEMGGDIEPLWNELQSMGVDMNRLMQNYR